MSLPYTAGGITSSATDLYRWSQALDGTKVLSAASKKLLFMPVKDDYAYGWIVFKAKMGTAADTVLVQEHNGRISGFASYLVRVPQRQQCIVLLDNHSSQALADLRRGLLRILNHQPALPPRVVTSAAAVPSATSASNAVVPVTVSAATLASYVGVYELAPTFRITVRYRAGQLYVQATGQPEFETEAASPVLFALKGVPAQVEFVKNTQGQVVQLLLHQGGAHQPAAKIE